MRTTIPIDIPIKDLELIMKKIIRDYSDDSFVETFIETLEDGTEIYQAFTETCMSSLMEGWLIEFLDIEDPSQLTEQLALDFQW